MKKAKKKELRRELDEMRKIGNQFANLAYAFAANKDNLTSHNLNSLHELQMKWDTIKKSEK